MQFVVVDSLSDVPASAVNTAFLVTDNWNDWYKHWTQFNLIVFDSAGRRIEAGPVKIARAGMGTGEQAGRTSSLLPRQFASLSEDFFSLGQNENYFESLNEAGPEVAGQVLTRLRDVAFAPELLARFANEDALQNSLLREISDAAVRVNLHDRAHGRTTLTPFTLNYKSSGLDAYSVVDLEFRVTPKVIPPTNVHALIGRNGAGKTHLLRDIAQAIVAPQTTSSIAEDASEDALGFARVVSVSFSAFDPFSAFEANSSIAFHYVGLQKAGLSTTTHELARDWQLEPQQLSELEPKGILFYYYFPRCRTGARARRWTTCLRTLSSDPTFGSPEVAALEGNVPLDQAFAIFGRFSSGHQIVLVTVMALVSLVEERTLVLMDEPEAHLHPPLLSSMVRAVSDLLLNRNGAAILATHSPIVLQEIPKECVYKVVRSGREILVSRPDFETFGEGLARLTNDVFGHEVTDSGFHRLIRDAAQNASSYDDALSRFDSKLGAQGRAMLRSLTGPSRK